MSRTSSGLSDVPLATTVPEPLAVKLRELAECECLSIAATARRLISLNVDRELERHRKEQAVTRGDAMRTV